MAANLDWNFGWLPAAIDEAGIWSNTIVVFTADHGAITGFTLRRRGFLGRRLKTA